MKHLQVCLKLRIYILVLSKSGRNFLLLLGSSSVELPAVELGPYFPYLSEDRLFYQHKLDEDTKNIKRDFASLVFDSQRSIMERSTLEDVKNLLEYFDRETFVYLLRECESFQELFKRISNLISFFDYDIIKLLTRKFASNRVKKKMEKYKKKFQEFSKRCVCELPSDAFGEPAQSEKVYAIKIDKSLNSLTVDDLAKLKYKMNRSLGHESLKLMRIEEGCVQLIFKSIKKDKLKISFKVEEELRKIGVLSISYGDQIEGFTLIKPNSGELTIHTISSVVEQSCVILISPVAT